MGNERERILKMVAEGDLTVDQADRLLAALEERALRQEREKVAASVETPMPGSQGAGYSRSTAPPAPAPPVPPVPPIPPIPPGFPSVGRIVRSINRQKMRKNPAFDHLIQLALHDISPTYVAELREAGLTDLTIDQVVQLGIHDVKPGYVKEMLALELGDDLTFDEVIQLAIHDVTPGYVRRFREAGLDDLDLDQVLQAAIHGIEPETLKEWKEAGIDLDDFASDDSAMGRARDAKAKLADGLRAGTELRDALREARDAAREALNEARDAIRDAADDEEDR